jgi:N-acetylglutamate synthase-like GNAT family acetyltransferase
MSKVSQNLLLQRAEGEFLKGDFHNALRSYGLILKDYPTLDEAKVLGVEEEVLVLTYLPAFFEKLGFHEINKEAIHEHKIWADCIKCIHFPVCNEIALVYKLP